MRAADGGPLDATEVVKMAVEALPSKTVTADSLRLDRIRLVNPLPPAGHGIREIQPLGSPEK